MTVGDIETRMSARELQEWRLYADIEPFGDARADHRAALIAQNAVNIHLKPRDRLPLDKFLLVFTRTERDAIATKPADDPASLMRKFKRFTRNLKPDGANSGNDRGPDRQTGV